MNSAFLLNIVRFFVLVFVQVTVFNNFYLFGFITPYPYILFIILYPVNYNRYGLLISSFLLGLILDMFDNSGGVHTAACLILAYFRPYIFKISFGLSYEYQTVKISSSSLQEQVVFVSISTLIHHFVLFLLEAFRLSLIGNVVLKVLLTGIFTIIFSVLIINLFKTSKK